MSDLVQTIQSLLAMVTYRLGVAAGMHMSITYSGDAPMNGSEWSLKVVGAVRR